MKERKSTYALTRVKTFAGREGYGLNAVIERDGKPVAFVLDDASGGPTDISFRNPLNTPRSYQLTTEQDARREEEMACAFAAEWFATSPDAQDARNFEAELSAKYPDTHRKIAPLGMLEAWVNHEADAAEMQKRFDKDTKNNFLYTRSDKPGLFAIAKKRAPADYEKQIRARYPSVKFVFLHEMESAAALATWKKAVAS